MVPILLLLGFMFSVAANDWRPLGVAVVMGSLITWFTEQSLHEHIHRSLDGDDYDE